MSPEEVLQGRSGAYTITARRPFAFGRTSVLYEAQDATNRPVCIKLFRDAPRSSEEFLRELEAQQRLVHPNVLPLLDFGASTGESSGPFIVYPLCRGGNLRKLIEGRSFLPPAEALPILEQVAAAIDFAHSSGFIHGDIKPENILMPAGPAQLCLADFGMSRYFPHVEHISTTAVFEGGGSTAYLSPEQIADGKQSTRSDIYSFGIVAFELLAGSLPFEVNAPPFRQMQAKVMGELLKPEQVNPLLPAATSAALRHSLHRDRELRPATARLFVQELRGESAPSSGSGAAPRRAGGLFSWWQDLDAKAKAAVVTAAIAALGGILAAAIKVLPSLF